MRLRAVLLWMVAATAHAQFSGLTTTYDGSAVWFSSALRQRGTDQFLWPKIFRIDGNGAALVAQRERSSPVPPTNPFMLDQPQVTGDGQWLLYRGTLICTAGSSCFLSEQHSTTLRNNATGEEMPVAPNARISRNGRYLATFSSSNTMFRRFDLTDRTTGTVLFTGNIVVLGASIASDGTAAVVGPNTLELVKNGSRSTLRNLDIAAAVIDDSAATIVYETLTRRRLFVLDLHTMQTRQLGPDDRDSFAPTLSADGQWVAYLTTLGTTSQLFMSHPDGSDWKQLTARPDGVTESTLSGDGNTAYAITGDGSMLRIDTRGGGTTALVGPTPVVAGSYSTTPGSLTWINGTGLNSATVRIAGAAVPMFSRSATEIWFQVPWEVPLGTDSVTIPEGGDPYFEDAAPLSLSPFLPRAIPLGPADPPTYMIPRAIHSDFASLVTSDNPARPGEILHMYLTGGGAVDPPVATNTPAPASPLSRITTPISVVALAPTNQPVQVYFFGLAPGLMGVWQMDFAVPAGWSQPLLMMEIQYDSPPPNSFGESAWIDAIPVQAAP